ncbi:MAG TPA: hypothetical protein VER55_08455 [Ardenticatenaceae bacterium]|nr:hypothetical protein [Ardenticatenaceae bacterium]
MSIEDVMGIILFIFGLVFMLVGFLAAIDYTQLIQGFLSIMSFLIFGFVLCITGFMMARSAMGGMMTRFRR